MMRMVEWMKEAGLPEPEYKKDGRIFCLFLLKNRDLWD